MEKLLTADEALDVLGYSLKSRNILTKLRKDGAFPGAKIVEHDGRKSWMFPESEVRAHVAANGKAKKYRRRTRRRAKVLTTTKTVLPEATTPRAKARRAIDAVFEKFERDVRREAAATIIGRVPGRTTRRRKTR